MVTYSRFEKGLLVLLGVVLLAFLLFRTQRGSNDINVYLHASQQFFTGENIYENNPFNNYLYGPLFAMLLGSISFLPWDVARLLWFLINIAAFARTYFLLKQITHQSPSLSGRFRKMWSIAVVILSLGFINHNINLGQITLLMVWLSLEGAYQVQIKKNNWGSMYLAAGMVIKIIPGLVFFYLLLKGRWKAAFMGGAAALLLLALPSVIKGWDYNWQMLQSWEQTINPGKEKYVFENNNGCHSLNAMLPSYFLDFEEPEHYGEYGWPRKIAHVPYPILLWVLQALRLLLVASLVALVWRAFRQKEPANSLQFFREISYLFLVSHLIFPHQMKYAMLYFVPAGAYVLHYIFLHLQQHGVAATLKKPGLTIAVLVMLLMALQGRDVIGDTAVNFLDYYHFMTFANLLFLIYLWLLPPLRFAAKAG